MIKFLFRRTQDNSKPSWDHDPECMNRPRDWNLKDRAVDPANILTFGNPLKVSQSDHYKERKIRRQVWDYLNGDKEAIPA